MRIQLAMTTSFGGLAAVGINVRVRRTRDGLVITRSRLDIAIASIGLLGFGLVPLYLIGVDGVRLIFEGNFSGERAFVAISFPLIVLVAILFVKSSLLKRPIARVSRESRSISYLHKGYSKIDISADEITGISIEERHGTLGSLDLARDFAYAVNLRLSDGNDVDIATHRSVERMQRLASDVAKVLGIESA